MRPSRKGLLNCTDRCPVSLILVPSSRLPRSRFLYNGQRFRGPFSGSWDPRRLQRELVLVDKPRSSSFKGHRLGPAGAAEPAAQRASGSSVSFPAPRFFPSLLVSGGQVMACIRISSRCQGERSRSRLTNSTGTCSQEFRS